MQQRRPASPSPSIPVPGTQSLAATVETLRRGLISVDVRLRLASGDTLHTTVTPAAADELQLREGGNVHLLLPAHALVIATREDRPGNAPRSSAQALPARVQSIDASGLRADLALTLSDGATLHAVLTTEAVRVLGLAAGSPVWVLVNAAQLLLAQRPASSP